MIVQCPVIFTNVRNGLALKTFEVNGIGNLSKPVINEGVERNVKKNQIFFCKRHDHSDIFCNFAPQNKDEEKQH